MWEIGVTLDRYCMLLEVCLGPGPDEPSKPNSLKPLYSKNDFVSLNEAIFFVVIQISWVDAIPCISWTMN